MSKKIDRHRLRFLPLHLAMEGFLSIPSKRIHLLSKLAKYNWNLDDTAAGLNISRDELIRRFKRTGFDYLLTEQATRLKDSNIDN